jgi:hypothetical protein
LWECVEFEVVQLLGVVDDQLLLTTPAGIRCLETRTGAERWRQPSSGRVRTAGRGVIAGDVVLWPTMAALRALNVHSGLPAFDAQRHLPPGDVILAGDRLLIVAPSRLTSFGD